MFLELKKPQKIVQTNPHTLKFIEDNLSLPADVAALKASKNSKVDTVFAVNQIAGRKIASEKLPLWASLENVIYPVHLSLEQCSSQFTAEYKKSLTRELLKSIPENHSTFVDLTGGFGVDFTILSQLFDESIYIEQQSELASIAQHNISVMCKNIVHCFNEDSVAALNAIHRATMIYIDPARRNSKGSRTYAIEDCTPNVLSLKHKLLDVSDFVIVKLSPMLDWRKTISDFEGNVSQVHIVSCNNECKELLVVLDNNIHTNIRVHCVNDDQHTIFCAKYDLKSARIEVFLDDSIDASESDCESASESETSEFGLSAVESSISTCVGKSKNFLKEYANYVYEPNASIMKSGCFELLTHMYSVNQIAQNSHVFVSKNPVKQFPGKMLAVTNICTMNKLDLKQALNGITHASIVVRNFPMSVDSLRKKLRIKDGMQIRIIATTDSQNNHILIFAKPENEK